MKNGVPYFSRVNLRRDASTQTLVDLLLKGLDRLSGGSSAVTGHHLVWLLFSDSKERERDFLWKETSPGNYYVLSAREPADRHNIFKIYPPIPFEPDLQAGDRLSFSLRANPVVRRRDQQTRALAKHDVVMNRLRDIAPEDRAGERARITREAGLSWLAEQGERCGFETDGLPVDVEGYDQTRIVRGTGLRPMSFSSLDFGGVLSVREPDKLLENIASGFGSARAFGCGLMLIRRHKR